MLIADKNIERKEKYMSDYTEKMMLQMWLESIADLIECGAYSNEELAQIIRTIARLLK